MTIVWHEPMPAMRGMPMPGGWIMSPMWLPMCGQTWFGAEAAFLGQWVVMMGPMMLPSLLPALLRYRQAAGLTGETRLAWPTALVAAGYAFIWLLFGAAIFALGATLAATETNLPALAQAVPMATGIVVLIAGALQFTAWKARHLACWHDLPNQGHTPANTATAWLLGMRLGVLCGHCSTGLTVVLLITGMMDPWRMLAITAAITAERLAGERVAHATGAIIVVTGLLLIARAAGFG
jgi:predicted metal-binding membrane protein